jgi:hypothetical protein
VSGVATIAGLADGHVDAVHANRVTVRAPSDAFDHFVKRFFVDVESNLGRVRLRRVESGHVRVDGEAKVGVAVAVVQARHLKIGRYF